MKGKIWEAEHRFASYICTAFVCHRVGGAGKVECWCLWKSAGADKPCAQLVAWLLCHPNQTAACREVLQAVCDGRSKTNKEFVEHGPVSYRDM
jgi:hypothetical protein